MQVTPLTSPAPATSEIRNASGKTHCPYCALQCAMTITDKTVAPRQFPTNRGGLCHKGWTSAAVLTSGDRLMAPLVRGEDGELHEASWDEAYRVIVDAVRRTQSNHGPDAVAVFGGGGLTNEKAYTLGKFTRLALRSRMIDYNGRFCMSSAAAAAGRTFGIDRGLPFPLTDLADADAILLVGSNPAETMPPFVQHLGPCRERGGLIVIDPRHTPTAALTDDGAGIHLQPLPGTDLQVLLGLLHLVIAQGKVDVDYLEQRVEGWTAVQRRAMEYWPERVERDTGVPATTLRSAAALLARSAPVHSGRGAFILTGRGAEQHAHGTDTVSAAINLALALGLPGRPASGYGCLTGQGNGQGGREHGQKCDQLPGYRKITDPEARAHVASVWGVAPEAIPGPGLPAVALLNSLGQPGGPHVLFVHGANPIVSGPNATTIAERLSALDLLVVTDFVLSETAAAADVVLPCLQWAEEEGTMTNLEGRILRRRQAVPRPDGPRDELRIWRDLAELLDSPVQFDTDPSSVFDELARASAGGLADYSGLSHRLLDEHELGDENGGRGLYWPAAPTTTAPTAPEADVAGTPRLFADGFPTPTGKATMIDVTPTPPRDDLRPGASLYLLTGRLLQHYQSGAQTRRVTELLEAEPRAFVQIHPHTAERLGVEEGTDVIVSTTRGQVRAAARLSGDIRPDCVFMPFHYPGLASVNRATNDAVDPVSSMPEFKVAACRVEPAPVPA